MSLDFVGAKNKFLKNTGVYILENTPPGGGGEYQPMSFGGKNMKRRREIEGKNVKEKGRKGKEKGRKVKENEKRGIKRVK